jgi:hypothetical protein
MYEKLEDAKGGLSEATGDRQHKCLFCAESISAGSINLLTIIGNFKLILCTDPLSLQ